MNKDEQLMYGFARTLMYSTGSLLKLEKNHRTFNTREKTSPMDLVTDFDLAAIEQYLVETIQDKYPAHMVVSEENPARKYHMNQEYSWIIDPFDGMVNFYRFGKDYAISLALYRMGEPVFGLVYEVAAENMYSASTGGGAAINGKYLPNKSSVCPGWLDKSVIAISCRTMEEVNGHGIDILGMLSRLQAHRYIGCASLELCKVATGEYDLFISSDVDIRNVAAAKIFLEQCGATLICRSKGQETVLSTDLGKLFVAAFRSIEVWEEVQRYFPIEFRGSFAYAANC